MSLYWKAALAVAIVYGTPLAVMAGFMWIFFKEFG